MQFNLLGGGLFCFNSEWHQPVMSCNHLFVPFLNFGDLVDMSVLLCQVTMTDRGAAERACKDPNPIIDGRKANVNLAYLGAKPRSIQTGDVSEQIMCELMEAMALQPM